jgi:hypothetical protein
MEYTPEHLKQALGDKYDPEAEYIIDTHRGAVDRVLKGEWRVVGEIEDATENDAGTMIIVAKVKPS